MVCDHRPLSIIIILLNAIQNIHILFESYTLKVVIMTANEKFFVKMIGLV